MSNNQSPRLQPKIEYFTFSTWKYVNSLNLVFNLLVSPIINCKSCSSGTINFKNDMQLEELKKAFAMCSQVRQNLLQTKMSF